MNPPKTLHITNAYHESSGGIRTFYRALLEAANRCGRHVRLVVPGERTLIEEVGHWGRIYHVRAPHAAVVDRRYRLLLPHRYLFGRRGDIWKILYAERPDLVEVCDKYSLVYLGGLIRARWLPGRQRPAVSALSCERMDDTVDTFLSRWGLAGRFARWYMRHVYLPQFDGHVAVSQYTASELQGQIRPVTVAPMGLDVEAFAAAARTDEMRRAVFGPVGGDPLATILLYVGRLSTEKGLPLLLNTMAALPSGPRRVFHLALAGDGPLRPWVEQAAQRLAPGRVHLLGHLADRATLAHCYANADLLVHPNAREPFGLAPLEAMAAGLPVVLPRAGGVLEYATDANAWLAAPRPSAMATAIVSAMTRAGERARRARRASVTASAHDWRTVTAEYFRIYDWMIEASAPTRPVTPVGWLLRRRRSPSAVPQPGS